jgi:GNAT superfamily N-acetyltransferase
MGDVPDWPLELRRASVSDMRRIVRLIEDAGAWLRSQGIDQWNRPWPNRAGRDSRIEAHLKASKTWIAWDGELAAATFAADTRPEPHWPQPRQQEPAVYVHRLVVDRCYGGHELGAALLDWTAQEARRLHGAGWIRINVWTTNGKLHRYYEAIGFRRCERDIDDGYPSSALFQRRIRLINGGSRPTLFLAPTITWLA